MIILNMAGINYLHCHRTTVTFMHLNLSNLCHDIIMPLEVYVAILKHDDNTTL